MSIADNQTLSGIDFKLFRHSFFQGTVTNASGGAPLEGALVEALKNGVVQFSTTTAADGTYSLLVKKGTYTLRASKAGFLAPATGKSRSLAPKGIQGSG